MTHISCNILCGELNGLTGKCKENSKDGKDGKDGKEDISQALLPLSRICRNQYFT